MVVCPKEGREGTEGRMGASFTHPCSPELFLKHVSELTGWGFCRLCGWANAPLLQDILVASVVKPGEAALETLVGFSHILVTIRLFLDRDKNRWIETGV